MTTRAGRKRNLVGLAIGDSITEGVRTLNSTATGEPCRNDSRTSWAFPLGELLGAEMGIVGFGGLGISVSGSQGVPKLPLSLPCLWDGQARSLATPKTPDFVIVHAGTNDSSSLDGDVATDMQTTLDWILTQAPKTRIYVLPNWLSRKAAPIQQAIANCIAPGRVSFIPTTGWWNTADASDALHPYGYVDVQTCRHGSLPRSGLARRRCTAATRPAPPSLWPGRGSCRSARRGSSQSRLDGDAGRRERRLSTVRTFDRRAGSQRTCRSVVPTACGERTPSYVLLVEERLDEFQRSGDTDADEGALLENAIGNADAANVEACRIDGPEHLGLHRVVGKGVLVHRDQNRRSYDLTPREPVPGDDRRLAVDDQRRHFDALSFMVRSHGRERSPHVAQVLDVDLQVV